MNKSKIYITNYFPYQNYDDAFSHTSLPKEEATRVIFDGVYQLRNLNKLCFEINDKIKDSTKDDFLLLTGKGTIDGFVLWIWLMKHSSIKILTYNQQKEKYSLMTLSVDDLANLNIATEKEKGNR